MFRRQPDRFDAWVIATGAAAAVSVGTAAFAALRRFRRVRAARLRPTGSLEALEDAAVEVLRRDRQTGACAIDVAALGPGIIELTGAVPTPAIAHHAARLLHGLPDMRTVISRLEVGTVEERLALNRERRARGEPGLRERRWYGVRVGTGRRRQSPATEPDRPDDSVARRMRELEVGPADAADAVDSPSTASHGDTETNRTRL